MCRIISVNGQNTLMDIHIKITYYRDSSYIIETDVSNINTLCLGTKFRVDDNSYGGTFKVGSTIERRNKYKFYAEYTEDNEPAYKENETRADTEQ